jgi:hypothetical protein
MEMRGIKQTLDRGSKENKQKACPRIFQRKKNHKTSTQKKKKKKGQLPT